MVLVSLHVRQRTSYSSFPRCSCFLLLDRLADSRLDSIRLARLQKDTSSRRKQILRKQGEEHRAISGKSGYGYTEHERMHIPSHLLVFLGSDLSPPSSSLSVSGSDDGPEWPPWLPPPPPPPLPPRPCWDGACTAVYLDSWLSWSAAAAAAAWAAWAATG